MDNNILFKLSYGLFVITANDSGKDNGCIINTVSQLTDTPLRLSFTINKSNLTHDMIKNTGVFNVSVISEDADFDLFSHFGFQKGLDVDKFADFHDAKKSSNGLFYITKGCNSYISGKVIQEIDVGTHTLFIADISDGEVLSETPSATYAYYHENIKPKPNNHETSGYRCKICGYVYEGAELPPDFICPLCKHGAIDFEKII